MSDLGSPKAALHEYLQVSREALLWDVRTPLADSRGADRGGNVAELTRLAERF